MTPTESVLSLSGERATGGGGERSSSPHQGGGRSAVLRTRLVGASASPRMVGEGRLAGTSNYLSGRDPRRWQRKVPGYGRVRYRGVYAGVDMVYYGRQGRLEYDFEVAPGADPKRIRLGMRGARGLSVDRSGDLVVWTAAGRVRQLAPVAYQRTGPTKRRVAARYVIEGDHRVSFRLGTYDRSKPLIIDPVLVYSTYLGGTGQDEAGGIAVDAAGSAYVTGRTGSTDFPTANPYQGANSGGLGDVFVTKLTSSGSALDYSTYLGGSGLEAGADIAVDPSGGAYVTGSTDSIDFPTKNPLQPIRKGLVDAFVAKLGPTGALDYSTYLGGATDGVPSFEEGGAGIAVDASGSAHVTGVTGSPDFPTTTSRPPNGQKDAFVTKLTPNGSGLDYSTLLGGAMDDFGADLAVDASGSAYVTGAATSRYFLPGDALFALNPELRGPQDAFVAKLSPRGGIAWATYLGGTGSEVGEGVAVDASGRAYVSGTTDSGDFPTKDAFQAARSGPSDVFVTRFVPSGPLLEYSTYLGGADQESGAEVAVDRCGRAYLTGNTRSADFPTATPLQATRGGAGDNFVTNLEPAGSLGYSTYLGGSSGVETPGGIAVDPSGRAYVAGFTQSTDFPTKNAFQPTPPVDDVGGNAFVTALTAPPRVCEPLEPSASISDATSAEGDSGETAVTFTVLLTAARSEQVTVDYATADDSATQPADYAATSGQVTFLPGDVSETVTVQVKGDSLDEPDERYLVNLSNAVKASIVDSQGVGTITDDDPPPAISIGDVSVTEGDTGTADATATMSLSAVSGQPVTVDLATADDTATAPADYESRTGSVTFAPGDTTKTVTVPVKGDTLDEPDERVLINLSNPQNASVGDGQGVVTITDDDLPADPPGGGGGGATAGGSAAGGGAGGGTGGGGPGVGSAVPGLPPGAPGTRCGDLTRPRSSVSKRSRLTRKRIGLSGRTTDRECSAQGEIVRTERPLARVEVSVGTRQGRRCRYLTSNGGLSAPGSCGSPLFVRAQTVSFDRKRAKTIWRLAQRVQLPRGRYSAYVRGIDRDGNVEQAQRPTNRASFQVR